VRLQRASDMAGGFSSNGGLTRAQVMDMISQHQGKGNKPKTPRRDTATPTPRTPNPRQPKKPDPKKKPTQPNTPPASTVDKMDLKKWVANFGGAPSTGGAAPCFFHWNRASGCKTKDGAACSKSHTTGPDEYAGKHLTDLTAARQKAILARCSR
jgi:hypothetical protein